MRRLILAVALGAVVGCSPEPPAAGPGDTTAGTGLIVTVDPGSGTPATTTLSCDPPGGDHQDPEAACGVLDAAASDPFAPAPADAVCGQIYGGPATATITGTWRGQAVDARFSLVDSCQISRWKSLVPVLPEPPGWPTPS